MLQYQTLIMSLFWENVWTLNQIISRPSTVKNSVTGIFSLNWPLGFLIVTTL